VVLFRLLIRRVWIADVSASILFGLGGFLPPADLPVRFMLLIGSALGFYLIVWILRRFGFLAVVTAYALGGLTFILPFLAGSFYAGRMIAGLAILAIIAVWALWVILSAQRPSSMESAA
jgi:hypothetical protein